jgi:predicted dehydrogenase
MLQPLIVGFGRAGRELHLRCLQKARADHARLISPEIGVVAYEEEYYDGSDANGLRLFESMADARKIFGEDCIVHICTPPASHFSVIREAAELGFKRLIVEKPLASTLDEVEQIQALRKTHKLEVFVVATWLTSSLTARLKTMLDARSANAWTRMSISQLKPRFSRTLNNRSHTTALDVEIPHQVALSLYLIGRNMEVIAASCSDMRVNGTTIPLMGAATILLQGPNGQLCALHSDLTAPVRQRSIEIVFEDGGKVVGYFPSEGTDSFSQLHSFGQANELVKREVFFDDPLSTFLEETYRYFEFGLVQAPASNIDFHESVMSVLCEAKRRSGLVVPGLTAQVTGRESVLS